MMVDEDAPGTAQTRNQLARSLARWDNEGGATLATPEGENDERTTALTREEQHILQCLGAAVIAKWTELPTDLQKALFAHAVSGGDPRHSLHLREQIARFLHNHKNDRPGQV
jgi:hypothetical protein